MRYKHTASTKNTLPETENLAPLSFPGPNVCDQSALYNIAGYTVPLISKAQLACEVCMSSTRNRQQLKEYCAALTRLRKVKNCLSSVTDQTN